RGQRFHYLKPGRELRFDLRPAGGEPRGIGWRALEQAAERAGQSFGRSHLVLDTRKDVVLRAENAPLMQRSQAHLIVDRVSRVPLAREVNETRGALKLEEQLPGRQSKLQRADRVA